MHCRRHQAAPKVVENLPAGDDRQRIGNRLSRCIRDRPPEPARDLPVPTHPPVQPRRKRQIVRRVVVDEMDIGAERGARVRSLEQIVAQQRVGGHASGKRRLKRVDVVDALADVAPLVKRS